MTDDFFRNFQDKLFPVVKLGPQWMNGGSAFFFFQSSFNLRQKKNKNWWLYIKSGDWELYIPYGEKNAFEGLTVEIIKPFQRVWTPPECKVFGPLYMYIALSSKHNMHCQCVYLRNKCFYLKKFTYIHMLVISKYHLLHFVFLLFLLKTLFHFGFARTLGIYYVTSQPDFNCSSGEL
jgi:hypothetical protein